MRRELRKIAALTWLAVRRRDEFLRHRLRRGAQRGVNPGRPVRDGYRDRRSPPVVTRSTHRSNRRSPLDAANIRLFNWNIRKQLDPDSDGDLQDLSNGKDLILIQEASLREETINNVDATKHWSFAPGYRTSGAVSGVLTLSSIRPLTQCSFVALEPVLRSPKATSHHGVRASNSTGPDAGRRQHARSQLSQPGLKAFRQAAGAGLHVRCANIAGPIIFSGDLNTWSRKRHEVVGHFAACARTPGGRV